ncbi:hypothetical protein IPM65_05730 [Candidatus Roizmanbacteria bacterium]|nr:MAG: hypothetical protein IPM65_05730 [Candidatus Roizmanbacteria bacterium]
MQHKIRVLLTPGVAGNTSYLERNTAHWTKKYNIYPDFYTINFQRGADAEEQRELYFKKVVDTKAQFLIAVSGSGLLALEALKVYTEQLKGAILISTRLRPGYFAPLAYLYTLLRYPIYFSYLRSHSKTLENLPAERVMTMYSLWDEVVPPSTVKIKNAYNFKMKRRPKQWPFHNYFSWYSVKDYEKEIIEYIKKSSI